MLLMNSNAKKEYERWKQGQVTQKEYRHCSSLQDGVRKTKAHLELRLAKYMKGNKSFYKHISSKSKTRDNAHQLLSGAADLVSKDMEEAKELNAS